MKYFFYLIIGILFGITLGKAEIVSWYRIYEMFQFDSFHMYGVIGSAVVLGIIVVQWMKKTKLKNIDNEPIQIKDKEKGWMRTLFGGTLFGLGWALVGACPGPMFILLGYGYGSILLVIFGALIGTLMYGLLKDRLPH